MSSFVNSYASLFFLAVILNLQIDATPGKDRKRAEKSVAQSKGSSSPSSTEAHAAALHEALEQVKNEQVPESPQEKEAYFMSHVSMGEQLSAQGMSRFSRRAF